jgi:hypothetical protein
MEMKLNKSNQAFDETFDGQHSSIVAIYPTRRPARSQSGESALHAISKTDAAHFPLTRIFHPYEYWTHAAQHRAGDYTDVSSVPERDPPTSGWPAAPPVAIVAWLHRWVMRGLVRFRAL